MAFSRDLSGSLRQGRTAEILDVSTIHRCELRERTAFMPPPTFFRACSELARSMREREFGSFRPLWTLPAIPVDRLGRFREKHSPEPAGPRIAPGPNRLGVAGETQGKADLLGPALRGARWTKARPRACTACAIAVKVSPTASFRSSCARLAQRCTSGLMLNRPNSSPIIGLLVFARASIRVSHGRPGTARAGLPGH